MRREERVTVQGPVKEHQPDGMSHRGALEPCKTHCGGQTTAPCCRVPSAMHNSKTRGKVSWGVNFAWEISCFKLTTRFPTLVVGATKVFIGAFGTFVSQGSIMPCPFAHSPTHPKKA